MDVIPPQGLALCLQGYGAQNPNEVRFLGQEISLNPPFHPASTGIASRKDPPVSLTTTCLVPTKAPVPLHMGTGQAQGIKDKPGSS